VKRANGIVSIKRNVLFRAFIQYLIWKERRKTPKNVHETRVTGKDPLLRGIRVRIAVPKSTKVTQRQFHVEYFSK